MFQYTRYILWRITATMLLICVSLTAIAWLTQSLRFLDLIVNRGLNISTFLYLSMLVIPSLLWVIIPISVFVSAVLIYHRLMSDSELVVLRNAGIDGWGMIRPAIIFGVIVTMVSYLLAVYLLPLSYREFKDMQSFIRDNYASVLLQEGVFVAPTKDLTVYIREHGDNGRLHGLLVHDERTQDVSITMMAEYGQLVQGSSGPRFLLNNGNRQEINRKTGELSLLHFERYSMELALFNIDTHHQRWREPQERYLSELFDPHDTEAEHLKYELRAEGHHRLTWPLYNLLFVMIALFPFVTGEFNRRGESYRVIYSVGIFVGSIIWALALSNLAANNSLHVSFMYITIVLLGGVFWLILHEEEYKLLERWREINPLANRSTI